MSKKTGLSAKIILLATMAYAVLTLINLSVQISEATQTKNALISERDVLLQEVAELEYLCESEDVAKLAREKLGMANDSETILYYKP